MPLLPGSPAVGAGTAVSGVTADQRGFALDSPVDIGAFQATSVPLVVGVATDGAGAPSGELDLRGAIDLADIQSGAAAIRFDSTAFATARTITLTAGALVLSETGGPISITGPAAGLTIAGGGNGRVMQVNAGVTATISGLTIAGGSATVGGGLYNAGTVTLSDCTISGNTAVTGGGLYSLGTAVLDDCTITGDSAASGGGLANTGVLTLSECTVSGNTAGTGGGIDEGAAGSHLATLNDTIVAGNVGSLGAASDIGGAGAGNVGGSYDLIGPGGSGGIAGGSGGNVVLTTLAGLGLAPLGYYGGPAESLALLPGSLAIDAGSNNLIPSGVSTDQRGEPRITNGTVDIGAFESQGFTLTPVAGSTPQGAVTGTAFPDPLAVTVAAKNPAEPVAGGVVSFSVSPAAGPGAALSAATAAIGSSGTAQVTATANSIAGAYSVTATAAGASTPASFSLRNEVQPVFSGLSGQSITYGTAIATFSGTIAAGSQVPSGETVTVSLDGATQSATIASDGSFSTTFTGLGGLGVAGSPYVVSYSYSSDGTYAAASQTSELTVTRATPTVSVSDPGGTYSGTAISATATVAGVSGPGGTTMEGVAPALSYYAGTYSGAGQLTGLTPLPGAPAGAGSYTVLARFPGSTDYAAATGLANFQIGRATPTVVVSAAGGTYSGTAIGATATVAGVSGPGGATLEGVAPSLSYYAGTYSGAVQLTGLTPLAAVPVGAGNYTVLAIFPGSADYATATGLANYRIGPATPTVGVVAPGGSYRGTAIGATATVAGVSGPGGTTLEGVAPPLSYYAGTYSGAAQLTGLTALSGAPTAVGSYTVLASFPGSADYTAAAGLANYRIAPATPTVDVVAPGGTYSGTAIGATATVAGVSGPGGTSLEGVTPSLSYYAGTYSGAGQLTGQTALSGTPIAAGSYTVLASFPGSTDYAAATGLANFRIGPATPTVVVSDSGGTYSGAAFGASATVTGVSGPAGATLEGVTPSLSYYIGTYSGAAQLTGLTPLSGAPAGVGSYTVLASFPGSADYGGNTALASFRITPAMPTVDLNAPGGTYSGTAIGATATVAGVNGPAAASLEGVAPSLSYYAGTYSGAAQLTGLTPLSGAPIGLGSYTVLASFPGSTDYVAATGLANFRIGQATPTVDVVAPGGTYSGTAIGATATVAGANGSAGATLEGVAPSLSYYAGAYSGVSQLTGLTPLSGAPVVAGSYTVLATFGGSTDYAAASALANYRIAPAMPAVTWNPPAAIVYGTVLSTTQLDATASVPGRFIYTPAVGAVLGAGVQTLSATFTPSDATDYSSTTTTTAITVGRATPTVSVSDGGGTYDGSHFAATATVAGLGGAPGPSLEGIGPTLTYYVGGAAAGAPMAGPPSAAGTYTVVASFPGSSDYASAQGAPATFTITAASAAVALSSSAGSTVYGQAVTLVAAVTPTGPVAATPTGTVTFFDGGTPMAAVPLDASGRATLTIGTLGVGGHSITAAYSGDGGFLGGVSGAVSQSVGQDGTEVVLVPHAVVKKKKITAMSLTAEVEPLAPGGGVPTGTVTFMLKKKVLGTLALGGGQATLAVKPNSVLNKSITIIYGGSADFRSSTFASLKLTSRSLTTLARPFRALLERNLARPAVRRSPGRSTA
jgi:hypothetical protein